MSSVTCSNCGEPLQESASSHCPNCNSETRSFNLEIQSAIHPHSATRLTLETYPRELIRTATRLLDEGQYGICVVVAHMACEVATEARLSGAFSRRGIDYLEEPVLAFLNGYNLGVDRTRRLYTAMTGDAIQEQSFWQEFKESAARRNATIHRGYKVGRAEATRSLSATTAFVEHVVSQ